MTKSEAMERLSASVADACRAQCTRDEVHRALETGLRDGDRIEDADAVSHAVLFGECPECESHECPEESECPDCCDCCGKLEDVLAATVQLREAAAKVAEAGA